MNSGKYYERTMSCSLVCAGLLAYAHAVDQGDEEGDESKDEDDDANVPYDRGVGQLEDDDEPDADEDEGEVGEDHQAADAARVRAERVGGGHRLHGESCLHCVLRLHCTHSACCRHRCA